MTISAVYLAAGFSKRFGANKLLHGIDGRPMFRYALERLISIQQKTALISQVIVVTQYDEIEQYIMQQCNLAQEVRVIRNENSEYGLSSSIQLGVRAAEDADAYLFCVADQPYLKQETIESLIKGYMAADKGIGCISWDGQYGNPTVFSRKYREELLELGGDVGGRQIIRRNPEDIYRYEVPNACEFMDIDFESEVKSDFRSELR